MIIDKITFTRALFFLLPKMTSLLNVSFWIFLKFTEVVKKFFKFLEHFKCLEHILMDNCSKCLTQEKTIIFLYLFILSIHLFSLVSNFNCNLFWWWFLTYISIACLGKLLLTISGHNENCGSKIVIYIFFST